MIQSCHNIPRFRKMTRPSFLKEREDEGFTLIEITVVMTLISIMLAMAVPSMRETLLTDQLSSTARRLIGTVRGLRNQAVSEQQPYLLHFDRAEKKIWFAPDKPSDDDEDDTILQGEVILPEGQKDDELITLWISKQGYMDETLIHLTDGDKTIGIFFSSFLATIKIFNNRIDPESISQ